MNLKRIESDGGVAKGELKLCKYSTPETLKNSFNF